MVDVSGDVVICIIFIVVFGMKMVVIMFVFICFIIGEIVLVVVVIVFN